MHEAKFVLSLDFAIKHLPDVVRLNSAIWNRLRMESRDRGNIYSMSSFESRRSARPREVEIRFLPLTANGSQRTYRFTMSDHWRRWKLVRCKN